MPILKRKKRLPQIYSILDSPAFGGAEQYMLSNLCYLSQLGHPICLATNNAKVREQFENAKKQFHLTDFSIISFPFVLDAIGNWKGLVKFLIWAPFALIWQIRILWHLTKNHSELICYWAGFSDRLLFSPLAKLFQCKLIWIEIGPLESTFKKNWGFPKLLYRQTQHLPDHFITTSLWTKKSMMSTGEICGDKIEVIYPGVTSPNLKEIQKFKQLGMKWRKTFKFEKVFVISFIGRMAQENEVDVLLKAVGIFHKNFHQRLLVVVIGDGPDKKRFQELSRSLKIDSDIVFTGFVSQQKKLALVATSDLFIFARAWELDGFGMTPLEGMSVEVPIITTHFGPQKEIITNNKNGLHFIPHSANDLANKIRLLHLDAALRHKLAKAGRETLSTTFTETIMHKKTAKTIEQVQAL
ncbi:MAG: glycosyltransferase family 4 protein [Patescibacteria group bacterium]